MSEDENRGMSLYFLTWESLKSSAPAHHDTSHSMLLFSLLPSCVSDYHHNQIPAILPFDPEVYAQMAQLLSSHPLLSYLSSFPLYVLHFFDCFLERMKRPLYRRKLLYLLV